MITSAVRKSQLLQPQLLQPQLLPTQSLLCLCNLKSSTRTPGGATLLRVAALGPPGTRGMGYLSAGARPQILIVVQAAGISQFSDASEPLGKGRIWLTADKRLIIATNDRETGNIIRHEYPVEQAAITRKTGRFTLTDGRYIDVRISDCGCGMGAAGNAALSDQPHLVAIVQTPDWVQRT